MMNSSIVSKDDIVPFNPALEPFLGFLKRYPRLKHELSISRALRYFQSGSLPREWVWKIIPSRQPSSQSSFMDQRHIPSLANQSIIPTPLTQDSMESIPEKPPMKRKERETNARPKRQAPPPSKLEPSAPISTKTVKTTSRTQPSTPKKVPNAEGVIVEVRKEIGDQEIVLSDMHSSYLRLSRLLRQLNRQKRDTERVRVLEEITAALKSAQTLRKRHFPDTFDGKPGIMSN
jgi:hypothetical protein